MPTWHGDHPVTTRDEADPHLAHVQRFPVKSLDPETPESATLVSRGAVAGDRRWAIVDRPPGEPFDPAAAGVGGAGDYVNGKKSARVHRLRSGFVTAEDGGPAVVLRRQGEDEAEARRFPLHDGTGEHTETVVHEPLNEWLSAVFDRPVGVRRTDSGHHDDRERHGPTVVSTATLREVAAWFDDAVDLPSARRRFRATLEIGGVPPFWEDRLFGDAGEVVAFRVGDATIHGVHPCQRCVVPSRDPDTGAVLPDFRQTFVERRRETRPPWTSSDRYDHDFRLMVNTRVPEAAAGETVEIGAPVAIEGRRA
jgi:uncharacterized protein YcbX